METKHTPVRLSKEVKAAKKLWMVDAWEGKDGTIQNTIYKKSEDVLFFRCWQGVRQEELPLVPAKVIKEAAALSRKAESIVADRKSA